MKKLGLILGVVMTVLPVMADDTPSDPVEIPTGLNVSELITETDPVGCSGDEFQGDHSTTDKAVQMAPVYVSECTTSGTYLKVADDASIGEDGTLSGVSCELCETGHECSGITADKISIEDGVLENGQGMSPCKPGMYADVKGLENCEYCVAGTYQPEEGQESCETADPKHYAYGPGEEGKGATKQEWCPDGYQDGAGAASIYGCQKRITTQMCDTYAENFQTGNMTTTVPSGNDALVNYRDISNHCFDTEAEEPLTCNAGYNTKQNLYQWAAENAGKIESVVSCPISGKISVFNPDTEKYEDVDCDNGQEPGTTKFVVAGNNSPMASINFVAVCSDKTADAIIPGSADYDDLTAESTGATCYIRNIDFPNQPWFATGASFNSISKCEESCVSMNGEYPFGRSVELNNGNESLVVKDSTDNYYAKNGNQFFSLIMIPENTCYDSYTGDIKSDYTTSEACVAAGYKWNGTGVLYYDAAKTPVNSIGDYTAVANENSVQMMMGLADLTESDTNAQVCTPGKVHITWTGVTLDANDPANTCTYDGALTLPNAKPEQGNSLFLGWKVVPTSTPQP